MPTMVTVELVSEQPLDEVALNALRDELRSRTGVVVVGPEGLQLTVTTVADDADGLLEPLLRSVDELAELLPAWRPIQVDAMTPERQAQVWADPEFPDLVGVDEVAEILGVSRPQALTIARRVGFPVPAALLASGPVWLGDAVHAWATATPTSDGSPRHLKAVPPPD